MGPRAALRSERGSSTIQFALVMPFLLILTVAVMDLSLVVWSQHTIANAAREGARYAIVRRAQDNAIEQVVKDNAIGLNSNQVEVITTWDPDKTPGSTVRIVVRYPFDPVTPFVARSRMTLEASAAMIVLR